jgi:hypothetical protein
MAAQHSDDHLGRLVVHSTPDIVTEIEGVRFDEAERAMQQLSRHESATVRTEYGTVYLIDGLHFAAGWWSPAGTPRGES